MVGYGRVRGTVRVGEGLGLGFEIVALQRVFRSIFCLCLIVTSTYC